MLLLIMRDLASKRKRGQDFGKRLTVHRSLKLHWKDFFFQIRFLTKHVTHPSGPHVPSTRCVHGVDAADTPPPLVSLCHLLRHRGNTLVHPRADGKPEGFPPPSVQNR